MRYLNRLIQGSVRDQRAKEILPGRGDQCREIYSVLLQFNGCGVVRGRLVRTERWRQFLNPKSRIVADNEPIHSRPRKNRVDSRTVEIDRGSRTETSGPGRCSGDFYRLLDGFGVQMQQCWIYVWIEPSLHQFRLPDLMPALVLHVDLNCRV